MPIPLVYQYSNYEEFGQGASAGIPDDVMELIAVDMGTIGTGCKGTNIR